MLTRLKHLIQRLTRGYDDTVGYDLRSEFARWIVPRLKVYRAVAPTVVVTSQGFLDDLDAMIEGFEIEAGMVEIEDLDEADKKIRLAADLFAKRFTDLWY